MEVLLINQDYRHILHITISSMLISFMLILLFVCCSLYCYRSERTYDIFVFCDWFMSLSKAHSNWVYGGANYEISSILAAEQFSILYVYHIFFTQLIVSGHLGCCELCCYKDGTTFTLRTLPFLTLLSVLRTGRFITNNHQVLILTHKLKPLSQPYKTLSPEGL